MKRYTEQSDFWKTAKILGYLANFLKNHQGMIVEGNIFKPITDLSDGIDWGKKIRERFPRKPPVEPVEHDGLEPFQPSFADAPQELLRGVWNAPLTREGTRAMLLGEISRLQEQYSPEKYSNERFSLRAAQLKSTLALSDLELDLLLVLALVVHNLFDSFEVHQHSFSEQAKATFVAKCLDCDISEILAVMDEKSKLRRYNCVDEDFDFNPAIWRFLNGVRNEPLSSCYFKLYTGETLPWEFYGTLAEKHGSILKRIINSAHGGSPVNILLYGASGTGKTSFARTLAAELKRKCYIVAQDTHERRSNEASSTPTFRFGALQICNSRVEPTESIIIVDEADEMLRGSGSGPFSFFGGSGAPAGDKGLLNAVLDTVTTPTIWITNTSAAELDESSRRRFDYSIRFEALNAEQRLSIWRNNVGKMELGALVSEEMMRKFAARYPVSAGGITLVLQNLAKLAPEPSEVESLVETLMKPHCELLGVSDDDAMRPAEDYSLDGLNIKGTLPLARLVEAVRRFQQGKERGADRPRMNILLSGAPGTGKTEFVKYLGMQLGTKVIVRMGSDLLDMYVGNTEKLIRQAFAQAEAEKAILFLDEIDGLLQSRERSHRSWEVTQVNELLHRMENFKGIMLGATNFAANLDAAVLRRFTFKLEFDYLDETGKQLFFERMFRATLTSSEAAMLARIPHLTPGDFRTVRQGLFYLGGDVSNAELLDALKQESATKSANRYAEKGKMGF